MKNQILALVVLVVIAVLVMGYVYQSELRRARMMATLFTGAEQYQNFGRVTEFFPFSTMRAAPDPQPFPENLGLQLPKTFPYRDQTVDVTTFLESTDTSALLVLSNGKIVFEQYWLTGGPQVNWLSMSVAKSFISAGIGVAVKEGLIDIQKPISDYVPSLLGSAYDGAKIKDVLQMSSGAAWNEDYGDRTSDVNRLGMLLALGGVAGDFVASLQREFEPGTVNRYNSADSQALGMLLAAATGRSVTDYLTQKIWHPLGMESNGYWLTDSAGVELAFFGLNVTASDYARLGELYRLGGTWGDQQIVSKDWVQTSTVPDAPHVMPGVHEDFPLGYGYQWWVPESSEGEYAAIGVYNQFIFVNPSRDLVIVKLSANSDYASSDDESAYRELETIEFFRELGRTAHPSPVTLDQAIAPEMYAEPLAEHRGAMATP
jgi:CubicO group peptidase (beta-lactamase class C family)